MQLYLDSADLREIREIAGWGVLSGLTTNPSLLGRQGVAVETFMAEVKSLISGPVSLEVTAEDSAEMIQQARRLKALGEQVVIKLPLTEAGLKAQRVLRAESIPTNLTLVFSANQALLAAAAGAAYVSPFMGRLDDVGHDGKALIAEIRAIFDRRPLPPRIIAASVRTAREVTDAALAGADITTIPYAILKKMIAHPQTDLGLAKFKADWERGGIQL